MVEKDSNLNFPQVDAFLRIMSEEEKVFREDEWELNGAMKP